MTNVIRQLLTLLKEHSAIEDFEIDTDRIGLKLVGQDKMFLFLNLDDPIDKEHVFVSDVEVSPVSLDSDYQPYNNVKFKLNIDQKQSLTDLPMDSRRECYLIGKQLSEAIVAARKPQS